MISISIVEDHDQYRKLLVKVVESNDGLRISGVYQSAEEALVDLVKNQPDIALVDIKLRSASGITLIKQVRSLLPNTQFLMCTAFDSDENVFQALKAGASGYIVKGAGVEEITDAIMELHNGGSPMSPYIARKVINLMRKDDEANQLELSERETEVLSLLSKGLLYKEISINLGISPNTVKNHCKNIYKRLHVQNKVEAINKFRAI